MDKQLDTLLKSYINNPEDPETNWAMAVYYDSIGQTAAALSYFLRTAERTDDKLLQYESMLRGAMCYDKQGTRKFTVRGMVQHAVAICPDRPEAYWLLSLLCESAKNWDGNWFDSYTYVSIALTLCDFSLPDTQPLRTKVDYPGKFALYFQKAHTAWWCGLCEDSREMFNDLNDNWQLPDSYKQAVIDNLNRLNGFKPKGLTLYDSSKHSKLHYRFPGSDTIKSNYSEAYQDMFVLTMLDGKRDGTYLEIGAGNSFYGNNTALLEQQFGWTGVGLDLDPGFVEAHTKERSNPCILRDATTIDYPKFLMGQGLPSTIDYLQIDCDPPEVSYKVLVTIPFELLKFDISPDESRPYEDWYVLPELINPKTLGLMKQVDGETKMAEQYMMRKQ